MILFYCLDATAAVGAAPSLPEGVRMRTWCPAKDGFPRAGERRSRNMIWWLFDRLGLFARPDFTEITLWSGDRILHRLIVTPRWLRFPFMGPDDLQIGDLWTCPDARGQGLARAAIMAAHRRFAGRARRFWYVVRADNAPSIRLIESCGYRLAGQGTRTAPLGCRIAGRFRLDRPAA